MIQSINRIKKLFTSIHDRSQSPLTIVRILLTSMILMTSASHAYTQLAKEAGISQNKMKKIVKKVVKYESRSGGYHVRNRSSGAYGRYQIMPKTARAYARKLGIPYSKWKQPKNQDRIFKAIMKDNIRSLKRNGLEVSAFSLYGTHQQGASGFRSIMKKKKLSKSLERNLRQNLPRKYRNIHKNRLRTAWVNYWKRKF